MVKNRKTIPRKGIRPLKLFAMIVSCILLSSCTNNLSSHANRDDKKLFNNRQATNTCHTFFETFDDNSKGWIYYTPDGKVRQLPIWDGILYCFSPWWVDYHHAPPGAGYLHILSGLHTHNDSVWKRQFKLPHDFTNAKVTVRLRGNMNMQNSNMLFLAQATNGNTTANYVLTAQPFTITKDWSEQTITLASDPNQWTCLGSRHDRTATYGCYDLKDVLKDLNVDFIFVLFPLAIEPVENIENKHLLQAGYKYHVKQELLPSGIIMLDWVKIEFTKTAYQGRLQR